GPMLPHALGESLIPERAGHRVGLLEEAHRLLPLAQGGIRAAQAVQGRSLGPEGADGPRDRQPLRERRLSIRPAGLGLVKVAEVEPGLAFPRAVTVLAAQPQTLLKGGVRFGPAPLVAPGETQVAQRSGDLGGLIRAAT